jgi:hypothetical protein
MPTGIPQALRKQFKSGGGGSNLFSPTLLDKRKKKRSKREKDILNTKFLFRGLIAE